VVEEAVLIGDVDERLRVLLIYDRKLMLMEDACC